jgi:UDP-GlcNAc:undecaprenyl-phosphate/decaprenyl-phosphate GlcNAc-1-phosphate transferase
VTQVAALPVVAFAVAVALVPLLSGVARRLDWVDAPGPLKVHTRPIPYTGGLAVAAACILSIALIGLSASTRVTAAVIFGPAAVMGLVGFLDDRYSLPSGIRLLAGVFAAIVCFLAVMTSGILGGDWDGLWWKVPLSVFYLAGAVNAVNMQDGLDGLAGGLVFLSSAACATAAAVLGEPALLNMSLAVCGAVAGFLVFNRPPATVFMGDNGSYFLGFVVGALTLVLAAQRGGAWHLVGGALIVGLPVVDAALAIARRLLRGRSPFAGDRAHLHDLLAQRGLSMGMTDLVCYAVQALLAGAGLLLLVT